MGTPEQQFKIPRSAVFRLVALGGSALEAVFENIGNGDLKAVGFCYYFLRSIFFTY